MPFSNDTSNRLTLLLFVALFAAVLSTSCGGAKSLDKPQLYGKQPVEDQPETTSAAESEEVVESKTNDTQIQEESDREPTVADEDTPSEVGAHTMRAEGDDSKNWRLRG